MLKLIMVLLWMILLEVLLCAEAENVSEVRGKLGAEVTLTCSDQSSDTHWYMEIHNQLKVNIGRSSGSSYLSPYFETKYSIWGNSLMIKNLTADDCRLYYCGIRRNNIIQFVETFHLVSGVTVSDTSCIVSHLVLIISVSAAALIVLIMGGVLIALRLRRNGSSKEEENPSVHIYENAETLWAMQGKVIQYPAGRH